VNQEKQHSQIQNGIGVSGCLQEKQKKEKRKNRNKDKVEE